MLKIAVTGSLSSGKTCFCHFLKELGAYVTSADQIVHKYIFCQHSYVQKIISLFGEDVVKQGSINRQTLSQIVFASKEKRHALEAFIHPLVQKKIEEEYTHVKKEGKHPLFVAEIPLLFESNMASQYDTTIAITAPFEQRLQRFPGSTEDFYRRENCQMKEEEKAQQATYIIVNDKDKQTLQKRASILFSQLQ